MGVMGEPVGCWARLVRRILLRLIIVAIVLVAAGVYFGITAIRDHMRRGQLKPFDATMSGFASDTQVKLAAAVAAPVSTMACTGKLYTMDAVPPGEGDFIYFDLPDSVRAATPGEVGTVAMLARHDEVVGQYGAGGGNAYRKECEVTVVDVASRRVVGVRHFEGGEPPDESSNGSSAYGSSPDPEIVSWLVGLLKSTDHR